MFARMMRLASLSWRPARTPLSLVLAAAAVTVLLAAPELGGTLPGPLPLFPPDNWWNADVSAAPVDGRSAAFITFINNGGARSLHACRRILEDQARRRVSAHTLRGREEDVG